MLRKTYDIIKDRERRGIIITLWGKIGLFVLFFITTMLSTHNFVETVIYITALGGSISLMILFLFLLSKERYVEPIGYILITMDVAIICFLPFLWYTTLNDAAVSRAFMMKTILPSVIYIMLIFNSFSLKPFHPLVFSSAASMFLIFLYVYAVQDKRVQLTDDFAYSISGPGVHTFLYFTNVIFTQMSGIILFFIAGRSRKTILQSAENEVAAAQLSRYFSPNVVNTILKEETLLKPGAKHQMIAVLFSDIRNFTSLCDTHSPEDILQLLSGYHNFMVEAIFSFGGTLDKYIGDGIMATFGTPVSSGEDALNAVRAAILMREKLAEFNSERERRGLFTISHGVGIHYGSVIVGNIGTEARLEYTAIGDTVNIASRVEGMCKSLSEDILITKKVYERIPESERYITVGEITLRGSQLPLELYSVSEV